MPWVTRRTVGAWLGVSAFGSAPAAPPEPFIQRVGDIERDLRARLGVWVLDTQTRRAWAHRAGEPFPMGGVLPVMACASLLARADEGKLELTQRVRIDDRGQAPGSSQAGASQDTTLAALCEAALTRGDRVAASLVLERVGGAEGLTAFMSDQGDAVSRLHHRPPRSGPPSSGRVGGTTTPAAMGGHLKALLLGSTLSPPSRRLLTAWLQASRTGASRLRAGLPRGWETGELSADDGRGTTNDVGIVWPPNHKPLIVSAFLTDTTAPEQARNAAMARIGGLLASLVHAGGRA